MARTFDVVSNGDVPDDWVDAWETDPGLWEEAGDDWEDPLHGVPRDQAERWREDARDHPAGQRRQLRRRDRGGWGSYPEW